MPTSYAKAFPEAMAAQDGEHARTPCFTHPKYREYLEAFLKELFETYPLDGITIIRDDNGGICNCNRCKTYLESSQTKSIVWELYLLLYRILKDNEFKGAISVYPYNDQYTPAYESSIPDDLLVVGHGSGNGVLARQYETLGLMGDTWLDNLFVGFRTASTSRMKRLLADRGSFWLGGAYHGQELTWESIGRFGWDPSQTVNTARYEWAMRRFSASSALLVTQHQEVYDRLREIYNVSLLPQIWFQLSKDERREIKALSKDLLQEYDRMLLRIKSQFPDPGKELWIQHMQLFSIYFQYFLGQNTVLGDLRDIAIKHREILDTEQKLAPSLRKEILDSYQFLYSMAEEFDQKAASIPSNMLESSRQHGMTQPMKDWVGGYGWKNPELDQALGISQFAGTIKVVSSTNLPSDSEFDLVIKIQNRGVRPWNKANERLLNLEGEFATLSLPSFWKPGEAPMVFGDRRTLRLTGRTPKESGSAEISLVLKSNHRASYEFLRKQLTLRWE